jgi:hypothetical protein
MRPVIFGNLLSGQPETLRTSIHHKIGMLFPALTWLLIQFTMSGAMIGSPADAMQIDICSPTGVQQIFIDPETGEPTEPMAEMGCEWCQSFGAALDTAVRSDGDWADLNWKAKALLPLPPVQHKPLRLIADFHSRAPPYPLSSHKS